jgi:hypothetical protein
MCIREESGSLNKAPSSFLYEIVAIQATLLVGGGLMRFFKKMTIFVRMMFMLVQMTEKEGFEVILKDESISMERHYKGSWDNKTKTFSMALQSDNYKNDFTLNLFEFFDWYDSHMDGQMTTIVKTFNRPFFGLLAPGTFIMSPANGEES